MSDYRLGSNGYMVHFQDPKRTEHRDVWIAVHGPIIRVRPSTRKELSHV